MWRCYSSWVDIVDDHCMIYLFFFPSNWWIFREQKVMGKPSSLGLRYLVLSSGTFPVRPAESVGRAASAMESLFLARGPPRFSRILVTQRTRQRNSAFLGRIKTCGGVRGPRQTDRQGERSHIWPTLSRLAFYPRLSVKETRGLSREDLDGRF